MRGLMVLCLVALSSAAPQGYNYPNQASGQFLLPSAPASATGYPSGHSYNHHQQQPLVSKRFFIHSAPEEEETEVEHRDIVIGSPRRNFNIVFVKSPSGGQHRTKVRVIPALNEDKTVIYVLAKKTEGAQIETHVEEPATTTSKPEVFFIRYKTNEEAEHAQHKIQAEYDNLGGTSIISNEGISPISSVIGSLDNSGSGADFGPATVGDFGSSGVAFNGAGTPSSAYLPPVNKI
ncbi:uncharacterized protein LOC106083637 [Stomoxys calcitrans]|uniref:DUF243 domain-containing protein n=1 Tax=Stomoxys calcitrans TaxID=35570 RepID=A0A1I8PE19_STOCA|nr:uncharacterized protein LOC106083637 [Stomoxys calcitrans]